MARGAAREERCGLNGYHGAIKIPYMLGLIAKRAIDEEVPGIKDLMEQNKQRIRNGILAYGAMQKIRAGNASEADRKLFEVYKKDLGYGLLLKRYTDKVVDATEAQIDQAANDTVPGVGPLFWSFRVMVASGAAMLFLFVAGFIMMARRRLEKHRWLLRGFLYGLPLPWIAIETGWFVAEYGRQPWAIGEILPTFLATSSLTVTDLVISLTGFIVFYTILAIIEFYLMFKFARLGPSSLHTGRYHFEQSATGAPTLADAPAAPHKD